MKDLSVVITSYNQKRYLAKAIRSVLSQTKPVDEIIICDDNSSDGSQSLIEKFSRKNDNIIPILHDKNLGPAKNRNTGFKEASGRYICYLDSDDWFGPQKLEREFEKLESSAMDWAYSSIVITNRMGNKINEWTGDTEPEGDIFK